MKAIVFLVSLTETINESDFYLNQSKALLSNYLQHRTLLTCEILRYSLKSCMLHVRIKTEKNNLNSLKSYLNKKQKTTIKQSFKVSYTTLKKSASLISVTKHHWPRVNSFFEEWDSDMGSHLCTVKYTLIACQLDILRIGFQQAHWSPSIFLISHVVNMCQPLDIGFSWLGWTTWGSSDAISLVGNFKITVLTARVEFICFRHKLSPHSQDQGGPGVYAGSWLWSTKGEENLQ